MNAQVETWHINQRINEFLLKDIKDSSLLDTAGTKGRNVGQQFAHIHNVRLMWLKVGAPDLITTQHKLETEGISTEQLLKELRSSADAVSQMLEKGFATGRIKGFKPHPEAFLGYLISHESHHRGQIVLILKENDHMPDKKTLYGIWEWGVR